MEKAKGSYLIREFMYKDLKLGGVRLMIYAAIYSFTVGSQGFYYGGQKYLAEITGLTVRTVQNQLSSLFEMGLIEKVDGENKKSGIRCRVAHEEIKEREEPMKLDEEEDFDDEELPLLDDEAYREGIKIMRKAHRTVTPKNRFYQFDKDGWVYMTEEQYRALAALTDSDKLGNCISRLSSLIEKEDFHPHSHYKTLREWILKDTSV